MSRLTGTAGGVSVGVVGVEVDKSWQRLTGSRVEGLEQDGGDYGEQEASAVSMT